jgi:hypothetical protein
MNKIKVIAAWLTSALLILPMFFMGCSTAQIAAFESEADVLANDGIAYAESIANVLQTYSKTLTTGVTAIQSALQASGLLPVNSSETGIVADIENDLGLVGTGSTLAESILTTIQTTGIIPAPTTTGTTTTLIWRDAKTHEFCKVTKTPTGTQVAYFWTYKKAIQTVVASN